MRTMPAGEFKARCLRVMDEVKKYRTPVVITKKGRAVAKLVPADTPAPDVFGCMAGTARIVGDVEAPVLAAAAWDAVERGGPARVRKRNRARRSARGSFWTRMPGSGSALSPGGSRRPPRAPSGAR